MAISFSKRAAVLATMICVVLGAGAHGEDAQPAVGPSFAQGSVKFQSVGVWSQEEGDQFAQLTDDFDKHQTIADDQPPTQGRNLAQITSKFVGAKLPSEEGDVFAELFDEFDDHQTIANNQPTTQGSTLAQIASKLVGAKLSSEIMGQSLSDFASLDDAFDANAWQSVEDFEEPEAFSLLAWLTNPYLYLTIAFVLIGGLVATSPPSEPEPQPAQQHQTSPAAAQRERAAAAAAQRLQAPETDRRDGGLQLPTREQKAVNAVDTATEDLNEPIGERKSSIDGASPPIDHKSLMQAVDACRAGEPGSYTEFCRVLNESTHA
jgi:hypothetical protein